MSCLYGYHNYIFKNTIIECGRLYSFSSLIFKTCAQYTSLPPSAHTSAKNRRKTLAIMVPEHPNLQGNRFAVLGESPKSKKKRPYQKLTVEFPELPTPKDSQKPISHFSCFAVHKLSKLHFPNLTFHYPQKDMVRCQAPSWCTPHPHKIFKNGNWSSYLSEENCRAIWR